MYIKPGQLIVLVMQAALITARKLHKNETTTLVITPLVCKKWENTCIVHVSFDKNSIDAA